MDTLMQMIDDHEQWVMTCGADEKQGKKAVIEDTLLEDLTIERRNLQGIAVLGCTLKNCHFRDTDLFGSFLAGCDLHECSFTGCILGKSVLSNSKFYDTVFTDCTLIKTELYETVLENVTFNHCDLTRAWFGKRSSAKKITLNDTVLESCDLSEIIV